MWSAWRVVTFCHTAWDSIHVEPNILGENELVLCVCLQMWWLPHFQDAKSLICTIPRMKRKALLHPANAQQMLILTENCLQSEQWCPYCPSNGASTRGEEWFLHPFVLNRVRNGPASADQGTACHDCVCPPPPIPPFLPAQNLIAPTDNMRPKSGNDIIN